MRDLRETFEQLDLGFERQSHHPAQDDLLALKMRSLAAKVTRARHVKIARLAMGVARFKGLEIHRRVLRVMCAMMCRIRGPRGNQVTAITLHC